jgi:hypothetical protein
MFRKQPLQSAVGLAQPSMVVAAATVLDFQAAPQQGKAVLGVRRQERQVPRLLFIIHKLFLDSVAARVLALAAAVGRVGVNG